MESISTNVKRIIAARMDEGDDLLLSIKKCAEEHNIKCGFFNMIGALKKITYGLYEDKKYRTITKTANHCFELFSTSGNITLKEGELLVHAHIIVGDEKEGQAFGGHLMEGSIVYPFIELSIIECDAEINRIYDPKTNLWPMDILRAKQRR